LLIENSGLIVMAVSGSKSVLGRVPTSQIDMPSKTTIIQDRNIVKIKRGTYGLINCSILPYVLNELI
jgi:hypothetical protein